jgi:hypothetical protein
MVRDAAAELSDSFGKLVRFDQEDGMNEITDHPWKILSWIIIALITPVGLIAMLVGASYLEFKLTRTQRIEDACRAMHIHEPIRQAIRAVGL